MSWSRHFGKSLVIMETFSYHLYMHKQHRDLQQLIFGRLGRAGQHEAERVQDGHNLLSLKSAITQDLELIFKYSIK